MRILFLSHFFPPTHTAGAENYAFNLAQALVHRGHQVYVLCTGTWDRGEHYWNGYSNEEVAGIQIRRLNLCWYKAPDPNRYLYDNPTTAEHLLGWLREIHPDVVHLISCYTLSASVIQMCKEAGLPLIVTLVDFWFLCPSLHLLRGDGTLCDGQTTAWQCLKCMLHDAKAYRYPTSLLPDSLIKPVLTAVSQCTAINKLHGLRGMALDMAERKQVAAQQLRQANVIIAPSCFLASVHEAVLAGLPLQVQTHGHDLAWTANYSRRSPGNTFRFCYMGQIAHDKGVHILLEAFLHMDDAPNALLDVWGSIDGSHPYGARVQELASRSERIRLRGRFARSQLADVLAQADVVVVPSIWYENNPLVIQEAFAVGVPVIATALGGMAEFVQHNVNGLLFARRNANDLVKQMQRVIEEPSLLAQLRAGIGPVKKIEQEAEELIVVYRQLAIRQNTHDN